MGMATVILAIGVKVAFLPNQYYNYKQMVKVKNYLPDIKEFESRINKLKALKNRDLILAETKRMKDFKIKNEINTSGFRMFFNVFSGFIIIIWAGLVQKYTFKLEEYPEMLTGGFLWFKDLSIPDPYFILPIINSMLICYNFISNTTLQNTVLMTKMRRFMIFMPLSSLTILTTFQTGFVLYVLTFSLTQTLFLLVVKSKFFMKYTKENEFFPGSKLEKVVRINFIQNQNLPIEFIHLDNSFHEKKIKNTSKDLLNTIIVNTSKPKENESKEDFKRQDSKISNQKSKKTNNSNNANNSNIPNNANNSNNVNDSKSKFKH